MRKLISLGLLAFLLSVLASPVLAALQDCEDERDNLTRGLYGLCVAYHNAGNENVRDRILDNFTKKAGPGGPKMPGTELPQQPDPNPQEVACPCWPGEEITNANSYDAPAEACQIGSPIEFAIYGFGPPEAPVVTFHIETGLCIYIGPYAARFLPVGSEEELTCRAGIQVLSETEDFNGITCS
jgi:hypothetical protein